VQATDWESGDVHPPPAHEQGSLHERVKASAEFTELRRRLRRRVFPLTAAFLSWYLVYVLLASYAREFMATPVSGAITVGLLVGLAQFVSTFALTTAYVRFAERRLDPLAAEIRFWVEQGGEAGTAHPTGPLLAGHQASPLREGAR
jgi:uncharacterized membrane protein (DUF485 family)